MLFARMNSHDFGLKFEFGKIKPNFVAIFGTAPSIIDKICSSVTEAKREAILIFSVCSEVYLLFTSGLANQIFTFVVYTNMKYFYFLLMAIAQQSIYT